MGSGVFPMQRCISLNVAVCLQHRNWSKSHVPPILPTKPQCLCCLCAVQGPGRHFASCSGSSSGLADSADDDDDLAARGTLAEVTVILRWERLVGRLAAAAAQRKALLLLQWLHLHLAFTEGCSGRGNWLSAKVGACTTGCTWCASGAC